MCTGVEMLAIASAATAATSYVSGQQTAQATAKAAQENMNAQMEQNSVRQEEINKQSANDATERSKQAEIERGRMRVVAGESGALGTSQDRLINDSLFQEGTDLSTIEANRQSSIKQTNVDANALKAQNQSAANLAYSKAPTLVGTGLQIGAAYGRYKGG